MAVPSLPSDLATGAVLTETWVDASRTMHAWCRDDTPLLKVRNGVGGQTVADDTLTQVRFSDGAASADWYDVGGALYNVGGWTAEDLGDDAVVPETGLYLVTFNANFAADATASTYRRVTLTDGGSLIAGSGVRVPGFASASIATDLTTSAVHYFTANDLLGAQVQHTAGNNLAVVCWLTARWIGSSTT